MVNAEQLKAQLGDLKTTIEDLINGVKDELIAKISVIEDKVLEIETKADTNSKTIDTLEKLIEQNTYTIDNLVNRVEFLETENKKIKHDVSSEISTNFNKQVDELSERIESRTNRQLRETLIIKGVPEEDNENWEKTSEILATVICENGTITYENAYRLIKRAHREQPNDNRVGQRHIYAAMHSWKFCEDLKTSFRTKRMRDSNFGISIESKYGPLTTWRRNEALNARRLLKAEKKIVGGFIAYPARLMVAYPVPEGQKLRYTLYKNFSTIPVVFKKNENQADA